MQKFINKVLLVLVPGLLFALGSIGQTTSNLDLVQKQDFHDHRFHEHKVKYVFSESGPIVKYNPLSLTFGGMLYLYQKVLSPQISSKCSYEISCSNFSKQSIKHHGLIKGIALSADRLSRCNKIAAYDIDVLDIDFDRQKIIDPVEQYHLEH